MWTSTLDKRVPLRRFEVPEATLSSLKASVAEQRRVMEHMGNKMKSLQQSVAGGGSAAGGKPGFYALPEGEWSIGYMYGMFVCEGYTWCSW